MRLKTWRYLAEDGGDGGGAAVVDPDVKVDTGVDAGDGTAGGDAGAADVKIESDNKPWYGESDWRSKMSRGDEKVAKILSRFASPEAVTDSLIEAQNRIRSGGIKTPFPKDGKPEEITAWREANGIPATPQDYGIDLGDDSSNIPLQDFLGVAHSNNYTPEQVKVATEWFKGEQARVQTERENKDNSDRIAAEDSLRQEWGTEYRDNLNRLKGTLGMFPESVRELMTNARLQDGTALFNNADVVRGFMAIAMDLDPAGTLVPSGGGSPSQGLEDEIGQLEKFMREHRSDYNKDEAKQNRLRELYEARIKLASRGK